MEHDFVSEEMYDGEVPQQTAEREVLEETGISVKANELLAVRFTEQEVWCIFNAEYVEGEPISHNGENEEALFMSMDEVLAMKIFLNGGGDGAQTIEANMRLNEVIDHAKPLLYIPLAMEREMYPSCLEWIKSELKDLDIISIEMVTSAQAVMDKDLSQYCAIYIGGGNTFKLLHDLKRSGAFEKIRDYIENDGIIFGGSAGTIIFGETLESCALDDANEVDLKDIAGFDVLNGISFLCHYTNRTEEKDNESKEYLLELSKRRKVIALPEEDTLFFNGSEIELIGRRPYYVFENGAVECVHPLGDCRNGCEK